MTPPSRQYAPETRGIPLTPKNCEHATGVGTGSCAGRVVCKHERYDGWYCDALIKWGVCPKGFAV
jgi:hypothetical protein